MQYKVTAPITAAIEQQAGEWPASENSSNWTESFNRTVAGR